MLLGISSLLQKNIYIKALCQHYMCMIFDFEDPAEGVGLWHMPAKGVGILDAECPLEAKQVLYTCHGE
jgi:hypothetical protein